jgi:hypothetical protein
VVSFAGQNAHNLEVRAQQRSRAVKQEAVLESTISYNSVDACSMFFESMGVPTTSDVADVLVCAKFLKDQMSR